MANANDPSIWEVEAEGSGIQAYPQLYIKFKGSLGFMYQKSLPFEEFFVCCLFVLKTELYC